jgi:tetraacyldisaccharide 4'-kinase
LQPGTHLKSRPGGIAGAALRPLSWLYAAGSVTKNFWYDRGLGNPTPLGLPSISVGNLTAGGTGKTPCTIWILQVAGDCGQRGGLLTRGYGGSGGTNDEIELLKCRVPGARVVARPDRVAGAAELLQRWPDTTFLLLDDGFQHRRAARDLDIVLVDSTDPFGGGACLPLGLLRETVSGVRRAHAVIATRCDQASRSEIDGCWDRLYQYGYRGPRIEASHAPEGLRPISGRGEAPPLESLRGRTVNLISAIGNPAGFERTVRSLGAAVDRHLVFRDHYRYRPCDLPDLSSSRGTIWITTEKDSVKLRKLGVDDGFALAIRFQISAGAAELQQMLRDAWNRGAPRGPVSAPAVR